MLKRPHILVVGSFMMDLIATTERAPGPGRPSPAPGSARRPAERGPTRPSSAPGWEPM